MSNQEFENDILNSLSKKLGQTPEQIKSSAKSGNYNALLGSMNKEQREKVSALLKDSKETEKLMKSPAMQALMKKFGQNG